MLKTVFKVYGSTIFAAVVILCLFTILANITYEADGKTYTGLFEIIGKASTIEETSSVSGDAVFKDFISSPRPVIFFDNTEMPDIIKVQDCELLKYIKVKFNDQENTITADTLEYTDFRIEEITNENGSSVLYLYNRPNKLINFNDSGIYTLTLHAIHNQKEITANVKIPVN